MNKNFESNKANKNFDNAKTSIEAKINNIFQTLNQQVSDSVVVVRESLSPWASCKGLMSVYRTSDNIFQNNNKCKSRPIARFAFYPDIYDGTKIGSIAIYGDDAKCYLEMLRKRQTIFGYKIKEVRAEVGMRLFVDVRLFA